MTFETPFSEHKLMIANRGEIAIRIARASAELGLQTLAVFAEDDANAPHRFKADASQPLQGAGPAAYLDGAALIQIAKANGCTLIHPGYGFLSERADFAKACRAAGLLFVGPRTEALALLGDKVAARKLAHQHAIPILHGTTEATTLAEAQAFLAEQPQGQWAVKALHGGGGRGMRIVEMPIDDLATVWETCAREAKLAFGSAELYLEKWLPQTRHVEIQLVGDGTTVIHLHERECSLQRRHQKVVEFAPAVGLSPELKTKLTSAAIKLGEAAGLDNVSTAEFLVAGDDLGEATDFYFIEANARLQVEHTVTEAVTGVDLVQTQLRLAIGHTLAQCGLTPDAIPPTRGLAVQVRITAETPQADGTTLPSVGTITTCELPSGRGVRVDSGIKAGLTPSPRYDSLLAKVIVQVGSEDMASLRRKAYRALSEVNIGGLATNVAFLQNLLQHPSVANDRIHTKLVDQLLPQLVVDGGHAARYQREGDAEQHHPTVNAVVPVPSGGVAVCAPMPGSIVALTVAVGDRVQAGQQIGLLEAMKMESVMTAPVGGWVLEIRCAVGQVVAGDGVLVVLDPDEEASGVVDSAETIDLDTIRPDLAEVFARRAFHLDENRPKAVAKRRRKGQLTVRENIANLLDDDSYIEYGSALVAAQRRRRSLDDLIANTPADGLVTVLGTVNADQFGDSEARCFVMAYDYAVLAGTQGALNHKKMDRLFKIVEQWRIPLVLFAEGGGGRPGDVDYPVASGLDVMTFATYARLSGLLPRVAIVAGYCFAGNAALAGCADVLIATENCSIGMGGPVMIEGGGLGKFHPKEVGPADVQFANGVIDILVADEAEASQVARQYLSYFQGDSGGWSCADQRLLRRAIPENRRRMYDVRHVIETVADTDSVLELRAGFGKGIFTALARFEGKPVGLMANNPAHLGGAIDSDSADKAARFMQLCNAFNLPIVSLIDTPGIMVGPDAEATGTVRHASRLFVTAAALRVPYFSVVLRKGYGLGAQAMAAGSFHMPFFTVAWPTGEFGAMGLEGSVRLGFRKELEAVADPTERAQLFDEMVEKMYQHGKGLNIASFMEIDEVIDPTETRAWLVRGLKSVPKKLRSTEEQKPFIDTW